LSKTKLLVCFVYPDFNPELVDLLKKKKGLTVLAMDKNPRITRS